MSELFTPRTPSRSSSSLKSKKAPSSPSSSGSGGWRLWRARAVRIVRWISRQLKRIAASLTRYFRGLSRTQRYQHAAILLGLIALIFVVNQIFSRPSVSQTTTTTSGGTATLPKGDPEFTTLLPKGKSVDDLGGWTRISPSDRNAVYAYTDTLADVSIVVSEQPLPDNFKSDIEGSVEKLSDDFSADRTFEVNGITVHIGKSAKGPQSLIFTTRGLLILIKSNSTISDDQWKTYITSLH